MFDTKKAFGGFAVDDLSAARSFYEDVLELSVTDQHGLLTLEVGEGPGVLVYPKPAHTPATFTVLNFPVADIRRAVDQLTERGVTFLRYPGFNHDEKGIARGEPLIAWFTDPAGNVFSVVQAE